MALVVVAGPYRSGTSARLTVKKQVLLGSNRFDGAPLSALMRLLRHCLSNYSCFAPGKSFLLNQLLRLPCRLRLTPKPTLPVDGSLSMTASTAPGLEWDTNATPRPKGYGYGVNQLRLQPAQSALHHHCLPLFFNHNPTQVTIDGAKVSLLYVDTEGFEGTGQADVYDDRIFALSVLVSSSLVYNLPETVKESDIEKLSFAAQLADEFYKRDAGRDKSVQLANLLWLIQRDFLEGKTVKQLVDNALKDVANPSLDKHITALNKVSVTRSPFTLTLSLIERYARHSEK